MQLLKDTKRMLKLISKSEVTSESKVAKGWTSVKLAGLGGVRNRRRRRQSRHWGNVTQ